MVQGSGARGRRLACTVSLVLLACATASSFCEPAHADSVIDTVAGNGLAGFSGDGGPATAAQLNRPRAVAPLPGGGFLIADEENHRIRKVAVDGTITTVAGNGTAGYSGDDGPATSAQLNHPWSVAALSDTSFVIADRYNSRIRKVDAGTITTLYSPGDAVDEVAVSPDGTVLAAVACCGVGPAIVRVDAMGNATTVAGMPSGSCGSGGDGGPATSAGICNALGLAPIDTTDFVLADSGNGGLRTVVGGTINTLLNASIYGIDREPDGGLLLSRPSNNVVDRLLGDDVSRVAGRDGSGGGAGLAASGELCDGAAAPLGGLNFPTDVAAASDGSILIADFDNNRIRRVAEGSVTARPSANLSAIPLTALTGETVTLDASDSSDCDAVSRYEWDLDGDGNFEVDTGSADTLATQYGERGVVQPQVRVTNRAGLGDIATGSIDVRLSPPDGPVGVSLNRGAQFTNSPDVQVAVAWPRRATGLVISNDGGFRPSTQFPVEPEVAWRLGSSGPERLPKTIYVRFLEGESGPQTYQDDIILDETPPRILSARLARARLLRLRIRAKDNVSGVAKMQITQNRRKPGRSRSYVSRPRFRGNPSRAVYIRVRDRAGSWSSWKRAKR